MTKEEFLDKKNVEIHKKILRLFDKGRADTKISMYLEETRKEYPNLLCAFQKTEINVDSTMYYQDLLVSMIEWFKKECIFEQLTDGIKILAVMPTSDIHLNATCHCQNPETHSNKVLGDYCGICGKKI